MGSFEQKYLCFSVATAGKAEHLELGDKILLPASALDELSEMWVDYPMTFQLRNPKTEEYTHCGVMEFSADEGTAVIPQWVMDNIALSDGEVAEVTYVSLEKAKFIKLQPHEKAFVELSNPKVVLEMTLRAFSCLTVGDTIVVNYLNRKFRLDVCKVGPDDEEEDNSAVCIVDTDCELDFDVPLDDYVAPEMKVPVKKVEEAVVETLTTSFRAFVGAARRLNGASTRADDVAENAVVSSGKRKEVVEEEKVAFKPFSGKSYRLMSD